MLLGDKINFIDYANSSAGMVWKSMVISGAGPEQISRLLPYFYRDEITAISLIQKAISLEAILTSSIQKNFDLTLSINSMIQKNMESVISLLLSYPFEFLIPVESLISRSYLSEIDWTTKISKSYERDIDSEAKIWDFENNPVRTIELIKKLNILRFLKVLC